MLLLIIEWSCIVLQTGRSYAAINNWMVMYCSTNRSQLRCYIENSAGLLFYKQGAAMLLLIIGWSCIVLQTGRSYAATLKIQRNCLFYKQDAAMLLLIIGWSCIVLQTGRSYAAINNWMVMYCSTNRTQLCCYIENSSGLLFYKQDAAMLLLIIGWSCIVLPTGRSYAAMMNIYRDCRSTNRARLCRYL
jgi:hypothetical protein